MTISAYPNSRFTYFSSISLRSVAIFLLTIGLSLPNSAIAEDFFVSVRGDDANPGTSAQPFRRVATGALSLSPGDTLFVRPGLYENEGNIRVRFQNEAFEEFPLVGDRRNVTRIVGLSNRRSGAVIRGAIDVRGAFITITGLTLEGTSDGRATPDDDLSPGIGVFESHNIDIRNCVVSGFGGGGIAFNQCDLVRVIGNEVRGNATTNPNQSSGISLFQSVVRTHSRRAFGAIIRGNTSIGNENIQPPQGGRLITDGNGIIIDDFLYTQDTGIVADAVAGIESIGATGVPFIEFDAEGKPLSYGRRTLIQDNTTMLNGGRGIHSFLSDHVDIIGNLSVFNLNSTDLTDGLQRDADTGEAFFVFGEVNLTDSKDIFVRGNFAVSNQVDAVGGAEQFFDRIPEDSESPNQFSRNNFRNAARRNRAVDVFGVDASPLLNQGRNARLRVSLEEAERRGRAFIDRVN